jgi:putative transposase
MRRSQHTEGEILHLLYEAGAGLSIAEICARITPRTFYRWRKRYGGLTPPALARGRIVRRQLLYYDRH